MTVPTLLRDGPRKHPFPNLHEMESAARGSETKECYREISRGDDHRLGVVASAFPSGCVLFSMEISLRLCRTAGEVQPVRLERTANLSRLLQRRGYSVSHLDDGWIVCEKDLLKEELPREQEYLRRAIPSVGDARREGGAPHARGRGSPRRS